MQMMLYIEQGQADAKVILDGAADALSTIGCAQLLVDDDLRAHNAAASELWRAFFAADEAHRRQFALADGTDSGGYHGAGALGRYNAHRSGVIYEHDEAVPQLVEGVAFVERVEAWRGAVTALARDVLGAVAARRGAPADMFAAGGAFDARAAGRFHVKRTHAGAARVLLPAHRDPSTLSLVVHFSAPPSGLELCGNQYIHGACVLILRVNLHAIDAPPARWRGDAGSSPLDGASTAASSPRRTW